MEAVFEFIDSNLEIIVAVALGFALALIPWLIKHPEDFYSWEEIDPDIYPDEFEDEYKA